MLHFFKKSKLTSRQVCPNRPMNRRNIKAMISARKISETYLDQGTDSMSYTPSRIDWRASTASEIIFN
jgi:hypothetical protein